MTVWRIKQRLSEFLLPSLPLLASPRVIFTVAQGRSDCSRNVPLQLRLPSEVLNKTPPAEHQDSLRNSDITIRGADDAADEVLSISHMSQATMPMPTALVSSPPLRKRTSFASPTSSQANPWVEDQAALLLSVDQVRTLASTWAMREAKEPGLISLQTFPCSHLQPPRPQSSSSYRLPRQSFYFPPCHYSLVSLFNPYSWFIDRCIGSLSQAARLGVALCVQAWVSTRPSRISADHFPLLPSLPSRNAPQDGSLVQARHPQSQATGFWLL